MPPTPSEQSAAFIPAYADIAREIGGEDGINTDLLLFVLQQLIERMPFDEAGYLARNPDVRLAIAKGAFRSGHDHFVRSGFIEGRAGGIAQVDEAWYLRTNPDVAAAVRARAFRSGADHYHAIGVQEWRAPNPRVAAHVENWHRVMQSAQPSGEPQPTRQPPEPPRNQARPANGQPYRPANSAVDR